MSYRDLTADDLVLIEKCCEQAGLDLAGTNLPEDSNAHMLVALVPGLVTMLRAALPPPKPPRIAGAAVAYTDGSCFPDPGPGGPGPGGWGVVFTDGTEMKGGDANTTNNRMEMLAAIKALEAVPAGASITIHTDSKIVHGSMTENWKNKANLDLWGILKPLAAARTVDWRWVKGHNGDPLNERADRLAAEGAAPYRKKR